MTTSATIDLSPAERILWSGVPRQGIVFRASDLLLVPFSLFWAGFAFFWEYAALTNGAPLLFSLWGAPFVLIGLYLLIGRFLVAALLRSRTHYYLTNQRVAVVTNLFSRTVESMSFPLSAVEVRERSDRSGTILFGSTGHSSTLWWGRPSGWPGRHFVGFDMIADVKGVHERIRAAQQTATQTPA
jgi:hypothetical protein